MMARGAAAFRQSDLTRALKGAKAAGIEVSRIKITTDGTIEIDASNQIELRPACSEREDQWDAALK